MPIDYTQVLLQKGVLKTLESFIQANVDNLNIAIQSDSDISYMVSTAKPTDPGLITPDHIRIGSFTEPWLLPANSAIVNHRAVGGCIRIFVTDPWESAGFSTVRRSTGSPGGGMTTTINSEIYIHFHQDIFRDEDKDRSIRRQIIAQVTIQDWIRSTFNYGGGLKIKTNSFELGNTVTVDGYAGDFLYDSYITSGTDGYIKIALGGDQFVNTLHLIHSGVAPT